MSCVLARNIHRLDSRSCGIHSMGLLLLGFVTDVLATAYSRRCSKAAGFWKSPRPLQSDGTCLPLQVQL